ncbi:MAG: alpha/beta fold hydrolase, partial [Candidatus Promineifilaceae bacterium]|nr:alpha/beta fold hydrolase [Candidatus Promineifilaceae bacterium]
MSTIVTEQGVVHYQVAGRGRPVILLHGWVNSWDVWRQAMLILARQHQRRVYALDFWGFGASGNFNGRSDNHFAISSYAEMV